MAEDSIYRLRKNMRKLVYRLCANDGSRTSSILGYSYSELINSLGCVPDKDSHIDHKIPISWFVNHATIRMINDLRNLHVISAIDNTKKGNRYCHPICIDYYNECIDFIKPSKKGLINIAN